MKKLIIIHKNLSDTYTGGQYQLAKIIENFKEKNIQMTTIDCSVLPKRTKRNRIFFILYFVRFFLNKQKNMFTLINHGMHFRLLIPFFISRITGNKYAVFCNQTFYNFRKNLFFRWLEYICEYLFLQGASLLIFPSRVAVQYLRPFHLEHKNKTIVNPTVNVRCDGATAFRSQVRNIIFVGQVRWWKGLDILISALTGLHNSNIHLDVAGRYYPNSKYFKSIKEQIHEANLDERITLHGHLCSEELAILYKRADIFILPSRYETFGIVLLEAMSFGLPIIASSIPAAKEIVKENINGILYDTENPQALTNAILKLISNKELRKAIHTNNLQFCRRKRTWEMVTRETLTAMQRFL